jgi:hypothetical protein
MDACVLKSKFDRIGARLKLSEPRSVRSRWVTPPPPLSIDIGHDRRGEFFDLRVRPAALERLDAVDVRPAERHLLLMARTEPRGPVSKFLCGHDERFWFVAAVPEGRAVSGVRTAMEALKPPAVVAAQELAGVRFDRRNRRRNAVFVRQGEWFFVPANAPPEADKLALRGEVLARTGGGKPHRVELLYRSGGLTVYMNAGGKVLAATEHDALRRSNPAAALAYSLRRRGMSVLVKGRVTHPDHATVHLRGWHEVLINTEGQSRAKAHVAFID